MTTSLLLAVVMTLPQVQERERPNGPPKDDFKPESTWKPLDKTNSIWIDPKDRRLILRARVCLRDGYLEHLLCSEMTKEHESILAARADPKAIKAGLILTRAKEGHPVRYRPEFQPPTGDPIRIDLEWVEDGKKKTADCKQWVIDSKTKKPLDKDWVFAGSEDVPDPFDQTKKMFAADAGDLFTVANFTSAILDLPFASSGNDTERSFVANTDKIPPRNTYVTMILRPAKPPAK